MDPNAALANLRAAQADIGAMEGAAPYDPNERAAWGENLRAAFATAVAAADALDTWMSMGGFPPDAWSNHLTATVQTLEQWEPPKFIPLGSPVAVALVDPQAVVAIESAPYATEDTPHGYAVFVYLNGGEYIVVSQHADQAAADRDRAAVADAIVAALTPPRLP